MELFKLFGSIFIDNEEANKSIHKTEQNASSLATKFGDGVKTAAKWATGIYGAATAVGAAVLKVADVAANTASRIQDLSEKIGISKTAFQEWDYVFGQVGANVEVLQSGMKKLSSSIYDAGQGNKTYADSLNAIGLSYEDLNGLSQEEQFNKVFAALGNVTDLTKRTALATDLLGKSATELAPILNMSTAEIEGMKDQAHDLGIVLSDEAVEAGDDFGDAMDTLKASAQSLFVSALTPLMPVLTQLINKFIEILPTLMNFINPLMEKLMPVVQRLIEALLPVFMELLDALMPILEPLIDVFLILVDSALVPLISTVAQLIVSLMPLLQTIFPILIPLIQLVADLFSGELGKALEIVTPAIALITSVLSGLIDFIVNVFTGNWEGAWNAVVDIFKGIWVFIKTIFTEPINFIIRGINQVITGINSIKLPDWVEKILGLEGGFNLKTLKLIATEAESIATAVSSGYGTQPGQFIPGGSMLMPQANTQIGTFIPGGSIPMMAEGGNVARSGAAIVGEDGPEVLNLPRGAQVIPLKNGTTAPIINLNFYAPVVGDADFGDYVGNAIVRTLKAKGYA